MSKWWQTGAIYQLLVPSFLDTNGDGMGDLKGATERLGYIQWLGAKAVWLTPFYPSPLADLGYDITNFCDVHPRFGTLEDFDHLLAEAHRLDLKVLLDWVPNHTSSAHPWFIESASSRDNPNRDWYLWRDGKPDGSPPNNWLSVFGEGVWQWHEPTGQYYLHTFLDQQPDLNWRNPDVRAAMFDTLRFWLDRGVDGFRIDALDLVFKDQQFRDNPVNPDWQEGQAPDLKLLSKYSRSQPGIHEMVAEIRSIVDGYGDDRMICGELYLPPEKLVSYYGQHRPELHLPLNLMLCWAEWKDAGEVIGAIDAYLQSLPENAWPTWTMSTHDAPRMATRCDGEQTRIAALMLLSLGGTPTLYYGEEIGMQGVPIPPEQATDPQGRYAGRNRDPERTPMQWNNQLHAGFSIVKPWLPIAEDFPQANVAAQSEDPRSLLALYRRLLTLRDERPALIATRSELISREDPLLAYRKRTEEEHLLVILNRSAEPRTFNLEASQNGLVILSTFLDREAEAVQSQVELRPDEGVIVDVTG